jgi:L-asparaginase/Glu-tRNA(Gln) amidotransferase subunit D
MLVSNGFTAYCHLKHEFRFIKFFSIIFRQPTKIVEQKLQLKHLLIWTLGGTSVRRSHGQTTKMAPNVTSQIQQSFIKKPKNRRTKTHLVFDEKARK